MYIHKIPAYISHTYVVIVCMYINPCTYSKIVQIQVTKFKLNICIYLCTCNSFKWTTTRMYVHMCVCLHCSSPTMLLRGNQKPLINKI